MAVATRQAYRSQPRTGASIRSKPKRRGTLSVAWALLGWWPLTPLGLAVGGGLAALLKWVALPKQDRVLTALALCGLAVEALTLVNVVLMAAWLRVRPLGTNASSLRSEACVPFRTGYRLGWAAWNPLVRIEVRWRSPSNATTEFVAERGRLVEHVTAEVRGTAETVVRRFVVADVLHLSRVRFDRSQASSVAILPARGPLARPDVLPQFVSGDQLGHPSGRPEGDLIEMRRYAPGDPLKLVLWKLYGRTGRLLVRTPERAVSPSAATLAYFVAGLADEASAGVARGLIENGALGNDVTFRADGAPATTRAPGEAVNQVVRSVEARHQSGAGLASFLDEGEATGIRACILFVPSRPGPWLDRVATAIAARPGPVRVFVGVDGLRPASTRARLHDLLVHNGAGANQGESVNVVNAAAHRLEAAGAIVRVVDRVSGRVFRPEDLLAVGMPVVREQGVQL
ncbi:MAG: DUF58 domain-containing protein [Isosphaeraceae bacterium]|nr:DUF58 domain-containing protein [Isosphaeraceae bacterium]